jgi:hypothetical protein
VIETHTPIPRRSTALHTHTRVCGGEEKNQCDVGEPPQLLSTCAYAVVYDAVCITDSDRLASAFAVFLLARTLSRNNCTLAIEGKNCNFPRTVRNAEVPSPLPAAGIQQAECRRRRGDSLACIASRYVYAEDMEKRDKLSQVPNSP